MPREIEPERLDDMERRFRMFEGMAGKHKTESEVEDVVNRAVDALESVGIDLSDNNQSAIVLEIMDIYAGLLAEMAAKAIRVGSEKIKAEDLALIFGSITADMALAAIRFRRINEGVSK